MKKGFYYLFWFVFLINTLNVVYNLGLSLRDGILIVDWQSLVLSVLFLSLILSIKMWGMDVFLGKAVDERHDMIFTKLYSYSYLLLLILLIGYFFVDAYFISHNPNPIVALIIMISIIFNILTSFRLENKY